jgi:hypothetical protein
MARRADQLVGIDDDGSAREFHKAEWTTTVPHEFTSSVGANAVTTLDFTPGLQAVWSNLCGAWREGESGPGTELAGKELGGLTFCRWKIEFSSHLDSE